MKAITIFTRLFFLLIICTMIFGCSDEKVYKDNGIKITMMKGLFYRKHATATIYYENNDIFVIGLKERFETLHELDINNETTIEEYANELFINSGQSYDLINEDNLYYFTYEYEINDQSYYYVSTIHKSKDSFWVCNFACKSTEKDKYHNLFIKWGKSISFY